MQVGLPTIPYTACGRILTGVIWYENNHKPYCEPRHLTAKFTAHLLSSACLIHRTASVDTDTLITHICDEAERLENHHMRDQSNRGSTKEIQTDDDLAATGSDAGRNNQCRKGKSHNCGKPGHWPPECRSPKKEEGANGQAASSSSSGTASKPETNPVGSANIVATNDADDDRTVVADDANGHGFWMVVEENASAQDISAQPVTLLNDPDEEQPDQVAGAHTESEEMHLDWCAPEGWVRDNWADLLFEEDKEEACTVIIPATDKHSPPPTKLYDSGATRHISPYNSDFSSYIPLSPPVFLNTANQQRFPALGTGTLTIRVPNKGTESKLALRNALHVLSVAYSLVSLGTLDEKGYHTHIGGGRLELVSPNGE